MPRGIVTEVCKKFETVTATLKKRTESPEEVEAKRRYLLTLPATLDTLAARRASTVRPNPKPNPNPDPNTNPNPNLSPSPNPNDDR